MTLHRSALTAAAVLVVLTAPALLAQERSGRAQLGPGAIEDATARLGVALNEAQRGHLWRDRPTRRGFGIQTAAWGAINVAIATWGLASGREDPALGLAGALRAEDAHAHVLLVNLGLNTGYLAIGSALAVAGSRGMRSGPAVKGHGWGPPLRAVRAARRMGPRSGSRVPVDRPVVDASRLK